MSKGYYDEASRASRKASTSNERPSNERHRMVPFERKMLLLSVAPFGFVVLVLWLVPILFAVLIVPCLIIAISGILYFIFGSFDREYNKIANHDFKSQWDSEKDQKWNRWFAWYPVLAYGTEWIWWRWVERRLVVNCGDGFSWAIRESGVEKKMGTNNIAFDEWKKSEIQRIEEERKKVDQAEEEFVSFLDGLKKTKDKLEFDQFLAARSAKS